MKGERAGSKAAAQAARVVMGTGTRAGASGGGGRSAGRAPVHRGDAAGAGLPGTRVAGDFAHDPRTAIETTVNALRYALVDVERAQRGLLRVTIERVPGQAYATPGDGLTLEDCEAVTRQLQYALEVEGAEYARLEVSSPGLDRPLRREADYARFCGQPVALTLKLPLQGRRHFSGELARAGAQWQLRLQEQGPSEDRAERPLAGQPAQVLSFTLDEVREARLVPVVDFKGRGRAGTAAPQDGREALAPRGRSRTARAGAAGATKT